MSDEINSTPESATPASNPQQPSTAPATPLTPDQTVAAPATPPAPGAPQQSNSSNGKAIGALVCGILAILASGTIIFGVILGIVAIILAAQVAKDGTRDGKVTAGKVCGIIGIVFSILYAIFAFVLGVSIFNAIQNGSINPSAFDNPSSNNVVNAIGSATGNDEAAVRSAVDDIMNTLVGKEAVSAAADQADAGFSSVTGFSLDQIGIDKQEYANWALGGITYSIDSVSIDGDTAKANLTLNVRDFGQFSDLFSDKLTEALTGSEITSQDLMYAQMGSAMKEAMDETGTVPTAATLTLTRTNGTWTVDYSSVSSLSTSILSTQN